MHANICYLNAKAKHLDILLNPLDLSFDLLAVSETWTAKSDHVKNIARLENYQSFVGMKGVTTKSGCGFYIRNSTKYKQRKDLDISYYDDNNEFQSSWTEIIKENEPNIIAGVFYRHPKKTSDNIFNEKLDKTLKTISKEKKINVIVVTLIITSWTMNITYTSVIL